MEKMKIMHKIIQKVQIRNNLQNYKCIADPFYTTDYAFASDRSYTSTHICFFTSLHHCVAGCQNAA